MPSHIERVTFIVRTQSLSLNLKQMETRMHSSRMRTGRSLTVCCSLLPRGGVLLGPGGISLVRGEGGVCLVWGGLPGPGWGGSPWSRGGSPCRGGVGGVCLVWGGWWCLPGPGGDSPETPPVYRITDTCKNITLATTSLRPVINWLITILKDTTVLCSNLMKITISSVVCVDFICTTFPEILEIEN